MGTAVDAPDCQFAHKGIESSNLVASMRPEQCSSMEPTPTYIRAIRLGGETSMCARAKRRFLAQESLAPCLFRLPAACNIYQAPIHG